MRDESKLLALRNLPAVHRVLADQTLQAQTSLIPPSVVATVVAEVLDRLRTAWTDPSRVEGPDPDWWAKHSEMASIVRQTVALCNQRFSPTLRPVLNLTGVVIHTNLGRAPLSTRALEAVTSVAAGYSNLEYKVDLGERGSRHDHVADRLCQLTGAEAAVVVNNNAAAVFLALRAIAADGEALVSRGELVEIGGSFRVPDIMRESGVQLVEVGTTNKTRLSDYERAIGQACRCILRVHPSNYRIVGFTESPSLRELVDLAHAYNLPVIEDLGSGALFDYAAFGIGDEPTVKESVQAGVDVVMFSGDKLLGGGQAGIIVGKQTFVNLIKKHPLMRALRPDKLTLAALEATLMAYEAPSLARTEVPVVRMLTESVDEVRRRAQMVVGLVIDRPTGEIAADHAGKSAHGLGGSTGAIAAGRGLHITIAEQSATPGGGSLPLETLPSVALRVTSPYIGTTPLAKLLRTIPDIPVIGRIADDALWLDVRTLLPGQEQLLADALCRVEAVVSEPAEKLDGGSTSTVRDS